jgi:integrator complex subunit 1
MLWNPVGPARKPPRESADLLMSVEEAFGLSELLQRSVSPDFILLTIGQTTRGAIELAYNWLIPIISRLPGTIDRLPSSTSCFLLLRAYGTDGEERKQLRELSAPLLRHVQDSLRGRFGESDAVKAFDLLMSDVASNNPDRRRCARRVLLDSLAQLDDSASGSKTSWMLNILLVQHAKALVGNAIKHMVSLMLTSKHGRVQSFVLRTNPSLSFCSQPRLPSSAVKYFALF